MLLVNGCSYTYGDELDDPINERWSTHLSSLLGSKIENIGSCGASNSKIFRTTMDALLSNGNDITGVIIIWSAFERCEFVNLSTHHLFWKEGNPEEDPWMQVSPSRLDSRQYKSVTKKVEGLKAYYNDLYTSEGGIWQTVNYMYWIKNLCDHFNIDCMQGWFHEAMLARFRRVFSRINHQNMGGRLLKLEEEISGKLRVLPGYQLIGCPGTDYQTFNMFTERGGYSRKPELHPGPEAHEGYAHYLFDIIKEHNLFEEKI